MAVVGKMVKKCDAIYVLPRSIFSINLGPLTPAPLGADVWGHTFGTGRTLTPSLWQGIHG